MTATAKPEIGSTVVANGIETNYLEDGSGDDTVLLIHGSGPGVTSYANWRLVIPALATKFRVIAPDMVGFGFSERPKDVQYNVQTCADQTVGVMDALGIEKASLVGNSFGGAIALRIATQHPERIDKLVLMGSMGVPFPITEGLERVWGYEASFENMRKVLDVLPSHASWRTTNPRRCATRAASSRDFRSCSRRCSLRRANAGSRQCARLRR